MRILLAIDGSGHSEAAVNEIARRHFPPDSDVRIVSVVESSYYAAGFPGEGANMSIFAEIESAARERAGAALEKAASTIRVTDEGRTLRITTEVLSGSPQRMILEAAEAFGADLIVVGSHGHGNFERFRLGSVAHSVAFHALCSVEIVRSRKAQESARM